MYIRIHLLHLFNKLELDTPNLQTKTAAMLQPLHSQALEVEHIEKFSTWLKHKLRHDNNCNFLIYLAKVQTDPPKKLNTWVM